jgi:hypothetical protein
MVLAHAILGGALDAALRRCRREVRAALKKSAGSFDYLLISAAMSRRRLAPAETVLKTFDTRESEAEFTDQIRLTGRWTFCDASSPLVQGFRDTGTPTDRRSPLQRGVCGIIMPAIDSSACGLRIANLLSMSLRRDLECVRQLADFALDRPQQCLLPHPAGRGPADPRGPGGAGSSMAHLRLSPTHGDAPAAGPGSHNAERVRRLMHELGLAGEAPRRRPRTTDSAHALPRYPNRVEGLEVTRPDQVWAADITSSD